MAEQERKWRVGTGTTVRIVLPAAVSLALFAALAFFVLLPAVREDLTEQRQRALKELVDSAVGVCASLEASVQAGDLPRERAQALAAEALLGMRYGPEGKDYFWIHTLSGRMIMHPYRPDLEGRDFTANPDATVKPLFDRFSDLVRAHGEGNVVYQWQWMDDPGRLADKMSHVKGFAPWGWVVGSGTYLDDLRRQIDRFEDKFLSTVVFVLLAVGLLTAWLARVALASRRRSEHMQQARESLIRALAESEERYRTVADFTFDWEVWQGSGGEIIYCSPACERITGFPQEKFFEDPKLIEKLVHPDDLDAYRACMAEETLQEGVPADFRIVRKSGAVAWVSQVCRKVQGLGGRPLGLRLSLREITERKRMEEQLRYQAFHDPLTGLANRTLCLDRIRQAMERAKRRDDYYFAVVFTDLDRFKVINDSLGHRFGDMALVETARRLVHCVRSLDTVSRFGGDEFIMLLDELSSPREAIRIVKRIREDIQKPIHIEGHDIRVSGSFGILLSPTSFTRPEELLQNANIAMHRAKQAGRNRIKVFNRRMLEQAVGLMLLESDLRRAIERSEFFLEYQPILCLQGQGLLGFEALVRWMHPRKGLIGPDVFIPVAEETGLILDLGEWVLRHALGALAGWRAESKAAEDLVLAVNISGKQFAQHDLAERVARILAETKVPANRLKLEITESSIMENPEAGLSILTRLKKLGVLFSIDDFGTGYSSLAQLQRLPVDTLKVDRTFVTRMGTAEENMEIIKAVIALAHSLGLDVVAEGVENESQIQPLHDLSCECVQGFYYSRPLPAQAARDMIRERLERGGKAKEQDG